MYRIDAARSWAGFSVRFLGTTTVHGWLDGVAGVLVYSTDSLGSWARVRVTSESLRSGNRLRDRHLASANYLDVRRHPEMEFRSREITVTPRAAHARGTLTIRGVTQPISLQATIADAAASRLGITVRAPPGGRAERLCLEARFTLDRRTFGIATGVRATLLGLRHVADVLIGRTVHVTVRIEAEEVGA
jgi:polyisoprenoid-binding protein YceI